MEKDEILRKSRAQKEDEGVVFADNNGRRFGAIGFCSVFCILVLFNFLNGQNNFAPFAMFWAYGAAEAYGKYRVTKKKAYMTTTILAAVASLCFLACHILNTLDIGV
jgi:hypothetical protein